MLVWGEDIPAITEFPPSLGGARMGVFGVHRDNTAIYTKKQNHFTSLKVHTDFILEAKLSFMDWKYHQDIRTALIESKVGLITGWPIKISKGNVWLFGRAE